MPFGACHAVSAALAVLVLVGCGPRAVRSPEWILGQSARYPSSQYIVGVGSAPTAADLSDALRVAGASARTEIAQTIEVRVDHVQQLVGESTSISEQRTGQAGWALEAENSSLSSFTRTSTDQIIRGIELTEKYHDQQRHILYVLAVLDKAQAAHRLEEQIDKLSDQVSLLHEQAQHREKEQDLLTAIKLSREALNASLKVDLLRNQLSVVDPYRLRGGDSGATSAQLTLRLTERLLGLRIHVSVEGADLVEDAVYEAMAGTDFSVSMDSGAGAPGLTLWGKVSTQWDTYPALAGDEDLQVCRTYLGLKLIDNRTDRIVGQVPFLANSNAPDRELAEERALHLLRRQILSELPEQVYRALSMETE